MAGQRTRKSSVTMCGHDGTSDLALTMMHCSVTAPERGSESLGRTGSLDVYAADTGGTGLQGMSGLKKKQKTGWWVMGAHKALAPE